VGEVTKLQLVSLLSGDPASEQASGFMAALKLRSPQEVLLIDGTEHLEERAARAPGLGAPDMPVTILLGADRREVMELLARSPIAAAIEKYALFSWWKHRGAGPRGAFWIHGATRIAERLGPDIELSPLYRTEAHCAFGSASCGALPELLARYVEAYAKE
jgi:hypothetical protein